MAASSSSSSSSSSSTLVTFADGEEIDYNDPLHPFKEFDNLFDEGKYVQKDEDGNLKSKFNFNVEYIQLLFGKNVDSECDGEIISTFKTFYRFIVDANTVRSFSDKIQTLMEAYEINLENVQENDRSSEKLQDDVDLSSPIGKIQTIENMPFFEIDIGDRDIFHPDIMKCVLDYLYWRSRWQNAIKENTTDLKFEDYIQNSVEARLLIGEYGILMEIK